MTVSELIAVLQTHPGDLRVVVNGYEEGFDDLSPDQISLVRIALNTGVEDYEGQHGYDWEPATRGKEPAAIVDALVLNRISH